MKYASEDLVNEHGGILAGLNILEAMAARIQKKLDPPAADLTAIVDFLKLFADKCHHGKEEGLFFPALEKAGVARENGPIGQMLAEHAQGRGFIARMAAAVRPGALQAGEFREAVEGYIALLRAHIDKENGVLFPMADRLIPGPEQARLLEAFERHEAEVMGAGTHERLHGMLDDFSKKYLTGGRPA